MEEPRPARVRRRHHPVRRARAGSFVAFPGNVAESFGTTGRVPVTATIDGVPYRGSLVTYGGPHLLGVLKAVQEQIGKGPGDSVHVRLELDDAPRVVDLAPDVEAALLAADALSRFRAMSYSHQREYALWVEEAKRPPTRASRVEKTVERVLEGRRLK
ncbi:DUF1905 domain-containing protein [Oerskovia sp. KBS0722]|nr:DUF1905 domain-containing protein [Oerskovia sp. KBS0722]